MMIGVPNQFLFISFFILIAIITSRPLIAAQSPEVRKDILQAANKEKNGDYVRQRFIKRMKKPFDQNSPFKKMLIIGDSHAQDFYNTILENNLNRNYQISTRRIPAICGIYLGPENISSFIEKKHKPICDKADTLKAAIPQIKQADIVIIAANWKLWSVERLATTVKNLNISASQKLFVLGRKSFGKINLRKYLRLSNSELRQIRNPVYGLQQQINQTMKQMFPKEVFVDIQQLLCNSEKDCPVFTPESRLISYDGGHLTKQGARFVGRILFQNPPLNQLK